MVQLRVMTRLDTLFCCLCGRNWRPQGKTHHKASLQLQVQLVQTNCRSSSTSAKENPGKDDLSFLASSRSVKREVLQASPSGRGKYLILFLTTVLERIFWAEKSTSHSEAILDKVLPNTVLWSSSCSLARYLTGNLSQLSKDWWKLAYLLHIITFGWMLSVSSPSKYSAHQARFWLQHSSLSKTFHTLLRRVPKDWTRRS